jgi:kynurenine--oxoglutarate transaminase/cysteine-S-conjugate beta-lyase/glutamine--phenylpyruvate transaminase
VCKILNKKIEEVLDDQNYLVHQYTRSPGHLRLVTALAKTYSAFMNREIDPLNEILITSGAYGSLIGTLLAFLNEDDEVFSHLNTCIIILSILNNSIHQKNVFKVVIIEPFFDCYAPMSVIAGAKCKFVPLKPKKSKTSSSADWSWDENELESTFNSKTRLIMINSPNNPLGKIFTKSEMEKVAELCIKYNALCISDEVYEHLNYKGKIIRMGILVLLYDF